MFNREEESCTVKPLSPLLRIGIALPAAAQEVYVGDPAHTFAYFETGHLGISWVHGRFNKTPTAKVVLDRAAKKGSIDVVIDTASVDTGHEARDKHVRSADYLDVEKFPDHCLQIEQLQI